ncbi:Ig-like domain repeat protein [uncultured Thiodictyon sp.]|uniref:InlB B-repeat-containing protein n=1 Tax=uncultured Thiodictyon sp. TaxID=1846217 RepID=UPI0025F62DBD|nr:Ig-like domain repeat protein [uncultured Thiodictyon sp.]
MLPTALVAQGPVENDTANADADALTDKFVQVAWADVDAAWPGGGCTTANLVTVNFSTLTGYTGATPIRFSASSTAAGYDFSSVPAVVTLATYPITARANPVAGGTVSCAPGSVYYDGTSNCTATANAGYTFLGWGGDCTGASCTLEHVTAAKRVTANFGFNQAGLAEDYVFTSFDLPDQTYSFMGINDHGQVTGTYSAQGRTYSFLFSNGVYTTLPDPDVPGTTNVWATGINDSGDVVGYFTSDLGTQGFRYHNGITSVFSDAIYNFAWSRVTGINDGGQLVGWFLDWMDANTGTEQGFIESGGVITIMPAPSPTLIYNHPTGINNKGEVVGSYEADFGSSYFGYLWSSDRGYNTTLFPTMSDGVGIETATPIAINDSGQVLLYYRDGCWTFVYRDGQLTPIQHPDAYSAAKNCSHGINDQGQVVGDYFDGTTVRGFIATPKPKTTVALSASSNTPQYGDSVTLTATVAPAGTGPMPTGAITFRDGAADIGAAPLVSGSATLSTSFWGMGGHAFTAFYSGGAANASGISPELAITVVKANQSALLLLATPAIITSGGSSTLDTTGGNGDGEVSYTIVGATGANCSISGAILTATGIGSCMMTATKAGDANYNASTSAAVTVTVVAPQFMLSVSKQGDGTVISDPAGIDCGSVCRFSYDSGVTVSLTTSAADGSTFAGWTPVSCSGVVALTADTICTATFSRNSYAIIATANPAIGGTATCTPSPVDYDGTSTCTATANAGYTIAAWSGDCTGAGTSCTLTNVTAAKSVTANFGFTIVTSVTPAGTGTVSCTPNPVAPGGASTCNAPAAVNPGYVFAGWRGDCAGQAGTTCTLSNIIAAKAVAATYVPMAVVLPSRGGWRAALGQ